MHYGGNENKKYILLKMINSNSRMRIKHFTTNFIRLIDNNRWNSGIWYNFTWKELLSIKHCVIVLYILVYI